MSLRLRKIGSFAVLALLLGLMATPAEASRRHPGNSATRDLQEKLSLLGYDPGAVDGRMGPKTRSAIREFQADADISVDGVVGRQTRRALDEAIDRGGRKPTQANNQLDIYEDVLTDRLAAGSVTLPSRYAQVVVNKSGPGRYTIAINGQQVATSPGANALPRISHTFQLPGEDVYVFAANTARRNCRLEHTVLVVRKDGTFMAPTPVGNCREVLNGRVQDDTLVLSFPPLNVPSWRLEESWIYQGGKVEQR